MGDKPRHSHAGAADECRAFRDGPWALPAARDVSGHPTQTRVLIECPFCLARIPCYVWSLAGSGKRCTCGALLTQIAAYKKG